MVDLILTSFPFIGSLDGAIALFIASFASIISVANPLSSMPVFTSLTESDSYEERIHVAQKACFFMFLILALFLFAGTYIISFFGISLPAIRVAGGFIILRAAWAMLTPGSNRRMTDEDKTSAMTKDDVSFSPLAMPLLAGPGSIAVVLGLASDSGGVLDLFVILVAILVSALLTYIIFRLGPLSSHYIGPAGMNAVTRLMGFIVMAIAVQFILSGIQEFFII